MSLRIDTADYFASSVVIGNAGLGVLAENLAASGDSGPGFLYPCVSLPADNGKEIRGEIITPPSAGSFFAYEDGSFLFSGAPDGSYSFVFKLYEDGVDRGNVTDSLFVGVINATASGTTLTGTASMSAGAAQGEVNATANGATLTGTSSMSAGAAQGGSAGTAPGATLTGTASLNPGAASGQSNATAPGATLNGSASMNPGAATGSNPNASAPGATLTGTASMEGGSAHGPVDGTAPGASMTGSSNLNTGGASNGLVPIAAARTRRTNLSTARRASRTA